MRRITDMDGKLALPQTSLKWIAQKFFAPTSARHPSTPFNSLWMHFFRAMKGFQQQLRSQKGRRGCLGSFINQQSDENERKTATRRENRKSHAHKWKNKSEAQRRQDWWGWKHFLLHWFNFPLFFRFWKQSMLQPPTRSAAAEYFFSSLWCFWRELFASFSANWIQGRNKKQEEEPPSSRTLWVGIVTRWVPLQHEARGFNEGKLTLLMNGGSLRALSTSKRRPFREKLKVDGWWVEKFAVEALENIFPTRFHLEVDVRLLAVASPSILRLLFKRWEKRSKQTRGGEFFIPIAEGECGEDAAKFSNPSDGALAWQPSEKWFIVFVEGYVCVLPARPARLIERAHFLLLTVALPFYRFWWYLSRSPEIMSPPPPPSVGGAGMRENFHFCVITKTAIETSQGKCTRLKSSTEFSPAAAQKLIFPTKSEEVFKNCVEAVRTKKSKQTIKRTKTRAGP